MSDETPIAFQGEVQFRRYSDTSSQGQQVIFSVFDRDALQPFMGKEGKRYMAVLVELTDEDLPAQTGKISKAPKAPLGPVCSEAVGFCNMPPFQYWITSTYTKYACTATGAKLALLDACGINSRRLFDSDPEAAKRWHNLKQAYYRGRNFDEA